MALNPLLYGHIVPWNAQFLDINGQPLANGHIEIFIAGTSEKYISYQNFDGNVNPFKVPLSAGGQCVAIGISTTRYDIYVYDRFGSLAYSRLNIGVSDSEGVNLTFTSSDGSIIIVRDGNNVDLTVRQDENTYGTIEGTTTDENSAIVFSTVDIGNIEVTNSGRLVVEKGKLYHISLAMKFATTALHNQYASCIVTDSEGGHHDFVLDESIPDNFTEISWDMIPQSQYIQLALQMPSYFSLEKAIIYVHRVNPLAGGSSGGGGGTQEQADWTETDTASPAYIKHKPDLSVYALKSEIPDVPDIPTPTAQQSGNILSVDDQGNPTWTEPQTYSQQQADWSQTDSSAVDYIKNKPSIPAAQVNSDWDANSGVAQILNKPDLSVYALKSEIPTVPTIGYTEL